MLGYSSLEYQHRHLLFSVAACPLRPCLPGIAGMAIRGYQLQRLFQRVQRGFTFSTAFSKPFNELADLRKYKVGSIMMYENRHRPGGES